MPAAHGPRRCETRPRSTQWSFKLREAKLQTTSLLVVGEALASPPSPKSPPKKTWTPRFLHPAEAPARFAKENAPKLRGAECPPPLPPGGVYVLRGGGNWLEISFWPPRRGFRVFLGARGPQKMILGASWRRACVPEAPEPPQDLKKHPPGSHSGALLMCLF